MPDRKKTSATILPGVEKKKPAAGHHWSQGLLAAMGDPACVVAQDALVAAVKDKYPKARRHLLVLAKESVAGVAQLRREHAPLVRHMLKVANELVGRTETGDDAGPCRMGFHAVPSMQRLHMHVISDDFDSPCLKTKIHWNSFNTEFFIRAEDVIEDLEKNGRVRSISAAIHKQLLASPLKCHKCDFFPANIPALKSHLLSHLK